MKLIWAHFFAMAIGLAMSGVSFADLVGTSTDSAEFDIGSPFTSLIVIGANEEITDLTLTINMDHSWIGDINATITHVDTGSIVTLISDFIDDDSSNLGLDPGDTDTLTPGSYIFSDLGLLTIFEAADSGGGSSYEVPIGTYLAESGLALMFAGESTQGTWRLDFFDDEVGDVGHIDGWSISFTSTPVPIPEPGFMVFSGVVGLTCLTRRRR